MLQSGMEKVGALAQQYPEAATTAEAALNIAGAGAKMALPKVPGVPRSATVEATK